ncbi:MAG: helix-turn-helix domain-containing protein [Lachnospiraceae bacterium]|nr:helix-turn-helix domain-containing protein [Lachnospiraceae bacterium]
MDDLISLSYFNAVDRHYHIHMPSDSVSAVRPHYHDYYQLLYVVSGQISHIHGSESVTLGRGDAFIIPPGFTHRLRFISPDTRFYSLAFSAALFHSGFSQSNIYTFLSDLQQNASGERAVHLRIELTESRRLTLRALLESLVREQESCVSAAFTAAPSLVSASLYILAQNYFAQQSDPASRIRDRYRASVIDCVEYVDAHYMEPITAGSVARRFAISRSALYELFPKQVGQPLHQYVRYKRILAAETLIRTEPGMTFSEISARVGYTEPSTFYRNFRQIVGASPSRYKAVYYSQRENEGKEAEK